MFLVGKKSHFFKDEEDEFRGLMGQKLLEGVGFAVVASVIRHARTSACGGDAAVAKRRRLRWVRYCSSGLA